MLRRSAYAYHAEATLLTDQARDVFGGELMRLSQIIASRSSILAFFTVRVVAVSASFVAAPIIQHPEALRAGTPLVPVGSFDAFSDGPPRAGLALPIGGLLPT